VNFAGRHSIIDNWKIIDATQSALEISQSTNFKLYFRFLNTYIIVIYPRFKVL